MYFNNLRKQYSINKFLINKYILKVLSHGQYILGPEVLKLENTLKKYVNTKYSLSVSSGTDALLMSLMALEVGKNDEVITSSFAYISTIEVIALLGAKPVLIDVDVETALIDTNLLEKNITNKTKAIIPVSLFGQIPNFSLINKIAKRNGNIAVIEDGAQSFGSTFKSKKSCSLSTIGITSFFPSKALGCYGDGGAIFTNNKPLFSKLKQIRVHGQSFKDHHVRNGIQGRMDTIQCAIILAKFKLFKKELIQRKKISNRYKQFFKLQNCKKIKLLKENPLVNSNYYQFCLVVENRKDLIKFLRIKKIPFNIYYPKPLNMHKPYKSFSTKNDNKNSSYLSKRIISLPMSAYLSKKDQNYILKSFELFINNS